MNNPLPSPMNKSTFGVPTDYEGLKQRLVSRGSVDPDDLMRSKHVFDLYVMHSFACQLRCDYCWLWGETGLVWDKALKKQYSDRIPLETMHKLIDDLIPYGVSNLNLSGGEPLMTRTWYDLATYARDKGLPVQLTTGGVLILQELDRMMEVLDQVNVSVNGPPSIADKVRPGPDGHYDLMMRGMREMTARKKAQGRGPLLRILSTITHTNYEHVVEMMEYFVAQGVEVDEYYFQFLIYNSAEDMAKQADVNEIEFGCGVKALGTFTVRPEGIDFDRMWEEVQGIRRAHPRVMFSAPLTRETLERYYTDRKWGIVPNYCATPWSECALLPNGDIYTCPDLPIGNILEQSFDEIWNGPKARGLRERLSERLFPACTGCFHYWGDRGVEIDRNQHGDAG